jgi:hypothetical protein
MAERTTTRIGAVSLVLGLIVLLVAEPLHPSQEDPMDHPAVFAEYARSDLWIAVHLGEYVAFLLLLGGLVALSYAMTARPDPGIAWARFGRTATVTATAAFTILQAVDGIALKQAVDAWVAAPVDQQGVSFAAAEAVRWIEMGVNALAYGLLGLSLVLNGLALALGSTYPRWLGGLAVAAGITFVARGVLVAYRGFVASPLVLAAIVLFAVWALLMAFFLWRERGQSSGAGITE